MKRYPLTKSYLGTVVALAVLVACGGPAAKPDRAACKAAMAGQMLEKLQDPDAVQTKPAACEGFTEAELWTILGEITQGQ